MTIAAVEETPRYGAWMRSSNLRRRAVIAAGLMASDLASFALADLLAHLISTAPSLVLFRASQ